MQLVSKYIVYFYIEPPKMDFSHVYNNFIISNCCNAFTHINNKNVYCTHCGKLIHTMQPNDIALIDNKYNPNHSQEGANVLHVNSWHYAANLATDPTYQLVSHKCPDCNSYCRLVKDINGDIIYVCSNSKCRHVWNTSNTRVDDLIYKNAHDSIIEGRTSRLQVSDKK